MPHLLKPQFEQKRHEALTRLSPLREADVAAVQSRLVDFLNGIGDLLVERAKRPNRKDPLLEVTSAWMGPASSHKEIQDVLRAAWPGDVFGEMAVDDHLEDVDELVVLRFVATTDDRYLTGRVLVRT
ncbi:MAG TPA: hypothetical protein VGE01_07855 [Fimbriimonas sp.]